LIFTLSEAQINTSLLFLKQNPDVSERGVTKDYGMPHTVLYIIIGAKMALNHRALLIIIIIIQLSYSQALFGSMLAESPLGAGKTFFQQDAYIRVKPVICRFCVY
jgi:hypothetical protein